jgi:hypothetical protein
MNFAMREHCTLGNQVFRLSKVYYSNSIVITNFMQTLISDTRFEDIFPAFFRIDFTQKNFRIAPRKLIKNSPHLLLQAILYTSPFIFTWGVRIQNNNTVPATC